MDYASDIERLAATFQRARSPWPATMALAARAARRRLGLILMTGCVAAGMGVALKSLLPDSYVAIEQVLFDPRGVKIFSDDLTITNTDPNAAIAFVESEMGVLRSERVLSRVVDRECADAGAPFAFARYCPGRPGGDYAKALQAVGREIAIGRAERSYVVDVAATEATPDLAARLAQSVVKAYLDEDAATRAAATQALTANLGSRLETLRQTLRASEDKAEAYRRDHKLLRVGDKLMVESQLATASAALAESRARLDRVRARVEHLRSVPASALALAGLGGDVDMHGLIDLAQRRDAARVEVAALAPTLGARNPAMRDARSKLAETERALAAETAAVRAAALAELARAQGEDANLSASVAALSADAESARQAEVALSAMTQEVEANRKLLNSFETRSREAGEFGRVEYEKVRVVSLARPPQSHRRWLRQGLWGGVGFVLGLLIAASGVTLATLIGADARRLRAEAETAETEAPGLEAPQRRYA